MTYLARCCKKEGLLTCIIDFIREYPASLPTIDTLSIPDKSESAYAHQLAGQLLGEQWQTIIRSVCREHSACPDGLSNLIWGAVNNFIFIWPCDDCCELGHEFNVGVDDRMNSEYNYLSLLLAFSPNSSLNAEEQRLFALLIDLGLEYKKTTLKIGDKAVDWRDWLLLFKPGLHSRQPGMIIPADHQYSQCRHSPEASGCNPPETPMTTNTTSVTGVREAQTQTEVTGRGNHDRINEHYSVRDACVQTDDNNQSSVYQMVWQTLTMCNSNHQEVLQLISSMRAHAAPEHPESP
jgi:hypothetical protein